MSNNRIGNYIISLLHCPRVVIKLKLSNCAVIKLSIDSL